MLGGYASIKGLYRVLVASRENPANSQTIFLQRFRASPSQAAPNCDGVNMAFRERFRVKIPQILGKAPQGFETTRAHTGALKPGNEIASFKSAIYAVQC